MHSTKEIGDVGEEMAARYLVNNGYRIVQRNYRTRYGEIDIIARDGLCLVFVEVKKKNSVRFGFPAEMVTAQKQKKLISMAESYLYGLNYRGRWRIDVIGILGEKIDHLKNITQ